VDELIKDKLEAQKEIKAREAEEKEQVAQQVCGVDMSHCQALFLHIFYFLC